MALYLIGDVQGCDEALQRLLDHIAFSPSRDTIYLLGDLVNRGPDSAGVLRRLARYGSSAQCLLGNHDLHLLALSRGVRRPHRSDTVHDILQASDRETMLEWLRAQHMALLEAVGGHQVLMVHAGVLPTWTVTQTLALAHEVESVLRGPALEEFLPRLYGDEPDTWSDSLTGIDRLRMVVNVLTRLRFCDASGRMEFATKEGSGAAPAGFQPWFEVPGRQTAGITVAFGHWSTLGALRRRDVIAMDTGCVWGGCLSAMRVAPGVAGGEMDREMLQVRCEAAQQPG
jgi:bis(5'-nucleosyl)-tetraphosphatase (symmetrical)